MSLRVYFPIYSRGLNRSSLGKLVARFSLTRYLLCGSSLPLRAEDRGGVCFIGGICKLVPPVQRSYHEPPFVKGSV